MATMSFELAQCFDIVFEKPEIKAAKLTIEEGLSLLRQPQVR